MSVDVKQFIDLHVKAHIDQSCPGLKYSDCAEAIEQELEVFVRKVRADTVASIAKAIRSETREASIYDLADELEKILDYKVWEADAEAFLMEAIGKPTECVYCPRMGTTRVVEGFFHCGSVTCTNSYRENKKGKHG